MELQTHYGPANHTLASQYLHFYVLRLKKVLRCWLSEVRN